MEFIQHDAPLSGRIKDINLNDFISNQTKTKIIKFVDDNLVVLIKNQFINEYKLKEFSNFFGELDPPGPISNVKNLKGIPIGNLGDGEATWHADMTYLKQPPKYGILYAVEVPKNQGNTHFANMYKAYDKLPHNLKKIIDDKIIIHDSSHNSAGMLRKGFKKVSRPDLTPGARHPAVITNPQNNKKRLFLGRRPNAYILGLKINESEKLLNDI